MNCYPTDFEVKLGFDQIRLKLRNYCYGPLGVQRVESMAFVNDYEKILSLLQQTLEFKKLIERGSETLFQQYADVDFYLQSVRIEGNFLEEEQFIDLIRGLRIIFSLSKFFENNAEEYPRLRSLSSLIRLPKNLLSSLESKFDEKGKIKDNASHELSSIRRRIREEESRVKRLADQLFRESASNGWVPQGASLTIRDGRMVIPVLAEHKRKLKGFIADESSTGQTVYIEPAETLEANNELRDLLHAERREVVRILIELTSELRQHLKELMDSFHYLGVMDFHHAKAKFAKDVDASMPILKEAPVLNWILAKHPLLYLSLKGKREIVPLAIDLNDQERFLLVSGPNAGGKSVCLKSVGLIQYMTQCGLLPSVNEQSTFGVFKEIFLDIGDQQSIDNDLSTYSSHLRNMRFFLMNGSANSLVLLDELGGGTDPNFGGGIAQSVLASLLERKVWGVATTHYYNLKVFASQRKDIRNGSMQFDTKKMLPLFKLEIGKPGSSFALEIARNTGLPKEVIASAEEIIGKDLTGLEMLIKSVSEERETISKKQKEVFEKEKKLKDELNRYHQLNSELDSKKKQIIDKAKTEAAQLLKETNREIEKTIRHIQENKAEKKETRKVRQGLQQLTDKVKVEMPTEKAIEAVVLKEGDKVRIIGQEVTGTLVQMKGTQAVVEFGSIRSTVKLTSLVRSDLVEPSIFSKAKSLGLNIMQKQSTFVSTLDVRGKRAEEVTSLLEQFLDDAILLGQSELKILHGKGEGVLRKVVRERLKSTRQVASFYDEHVERGGDGITVVVLK
jgi:DNA mismatch repair protein MutS2